uniref:histidine--tRNA ligase n=1 Tax=Callithamnion tetricum TaxID=193179 RepID=A0A4D6WTP2_9FLOR|nr:Histidine-tRNA ligase [Callithamnion tetricum]
MQLLRGTKDILPDEIIFWQHIYKTVYKILDLHNYNEIRTPIIESTNLFKRSIGNDTDIISKEMYSFLDQGDRSITLRPEGTASISRSFISNKLYTKKNIHKLWYMGPMFRYERPQNGRQRQFHQLGIECIGSSNPIADAEVIQLADQILNQLKCSNYSIEINSIGNFKERAAYKQKLITYLKPYTQDLDQDSQKRLITNPLRILDSKNYKTQEILSKAPNLKEHLTKDSLEHFEQVCIFLNALKIPYNINNKLIRGLDYYNYTAFEILVKNQTNKETICGGGRYDTLIQQLGGPMTPSVGWAIGIERLLIIINNSLKLENNHTLVYIAPIGIKAQIKVWEFITLLENHEVKFELDLSNDSLKKKIKHANQIEAKFCMIIGDEEIAANNIAIKNLVTGKQQNIPITEFSTILKQIKNT